MVKNAPSFHKLGEKETEFENGVRKKKGKKKKVRLFVSGYCDSVNWK